MNFIRGGILLCVGFFVSQMLLEKYNQLSLTNGGFDELFTYIGQQIVWPSILFGAFFVSLWLWSSLFLRYIRRPREWSVASRQLLHLARLHRSSLAGIWLKGLTHPGWLFLVFYMVPLMLGFLATMPSAFL